MRTAPATAPTTHTNTAPVRDSAAGGQLLCICSYPWIKHNSISRAQLVAKVTRNS
jgi:hypothetical protein